jgi:hypothetical protein
MNRDKSIYSLKNQTTVPKPNQPELIFVFHEF